MQAKLTSSLLWGCAHATGDPAAVAGLARAQPVRRRQLAAVTLARRALDLHRLHLRVVERRAFRGREGGVADRLVVGSVAVRVGQLAVVLQRPFAVGTVLEPQEPDVVWPAHATPQHQSGGAPTESQRESARGEQRLAERKLQTAWSCMLRTGRVVHDLADGGEPRHSEHRVAIHLPPPLRSQDTAHVSRKRRGVAARPRPPGAR